MSSFYQLCKQPYIDAPLGDLVNNFLLSRRTAREWQAARTQAASILHAYVEELQQLLAQMHTFSHETSIETVIDVQARSAALRSAIQSIERELQRLDKAYKDMAQVERLLGDKAMLPTA